MAQKRKYCNSNRLLRSFLKNLKRNTLAILQLDNSMRNGECVKNKIDKIMQLSETIDEKLQVVHKLRNDIKIYKTINTILTNHYVNEIKNHENTIDGKIVKLDGDIKESYEKIRIDLAVINERTKILIDRPASAESVKNSNILLVNNDSHRLPFAEINKRNEMYNYVIQRIDNMLYGLAYQNRIKEEEQKQAETARLEEILSMCAEYEKQIASGIPITPTEKRSQNKIITNGSLPRSVVLSNPNIVQTSDGYYKFDTSHNRNNSLSTSLPMQRNLSSYENFNITQTSQLSNVEPSLTPEVTIRHENVGRMDEIGIPVFEDPDSPKNYPIAELSSPMLIRKIRNAQQNGELPKIPLNLTSSPIGSPYENMYLGRSNMYGNLKPKSPNTQSPRTRIKTSFAHKNLPSPQYFVFPTPPPVEDSTKKLPGSPHLNRKVQDDQNQTNDIDTNIKSSHEGFAGIEKQLSLEEEIPMIDDSNLTDDIEFRYSKIISDLKEPMENLEPSHVEVDMGNENLTRNKSFEDIKKELMADIPELDEFERELKEKNREKFTEKVTEDLQSMVIDPNVMTTVVLDENENLEEIRNKYENLREDRRKYVSEIHEIKCKMTEIRSQEDDILRELEMEKALIKGEYDSEIAILNIEQKKKVELADKAKKVEEDIKRLKRKQEAKQNEMRDRVEIATLKVERIEKDLRGNAATVEELQNAQDILDNETKIYEDLEFQHLEEESEMLAYREDLQNEIIILTKKIEAQKSRILNLKAEANSNLTSALDETKILQAEYVRLLNQVEELTGKVQTIEKELKPLLTKLNDMERTQSPDSAFYTDQTRTKSGEFGYSPQSSDSDDIDLSKIANYDDHRQHLKDKFNSIDQMSQSMIVDIERRDISDLIDDITIMNDSRENGVPLDQKSERQSESPSKSSNSSKEKKGFWERNFDSLSRLKKDKKPKSPPAKVDIMSQSLNENMFYNSENIETECNFDKFNSLRLSKGKKDKKGETAPMKSSSSSKIPTFAALGKIMKRDSFGKKTKENGFTPTEDGVDDPKTKSRYVKNPKPTSENKYVKAKSLSPDKIKERPEEIPTVMETKEDIPNQKGHNVTFEELVRKTSKDNTTDVENFVINKLMHRKSCGDEPGLRLVANESRISDSGKIPSQDDIDRISKVTLDAPILGSDADMNSLGRRTLDSLMEIERKRVAMLEEQGCQVIENEREKISELKKRVQNEARKLWDQKTKSQELKLDDEEKSTQHDTSSSENQEVSSGVKEESKTQESMNELSGQDSFYDREPPFEDSSILEDHFNMTNSIYDERPVVVSRPFSHFRHMNEHGRYLCRLRVTVRLLVEIPAFIIYPEHSERSITSYNYKTSVYSRSSDLKRHIDRWHFDLNKLSSRPPPHRVRQVVGHGPSVTSTATTISQPAPGQREAFEIEAEIDES
ncbi:Pleckstrin homology-like domain family B member 2 [Eumeta japonica]|uniref:Pleckstrin homology-like domain family B member 2 n=1 Tax=Eumeta variegata TaxID=151549 RepID=A0A4C1UL05_EUMVA|nr:Pleckstrin homology-like domain family B member 2 [Eumeta japonica]